MHWRASAQGQDQFIGLIIYNARKSRNIYHRIIIGIAAKRGLCRHRLNAKMLLLFHSISNDRSSVIEPRYVYHLENSPSSPRQNRQWTKNLKSVADQEMAFCPYGHEAAPIRHNDANAGTPCPDSADDQHQMRISAVVAVSCP